MTPILLAEGLSKAYRPRTIRDVAFAPERGGASFSRGRIALEPIDLRLERGASLGIIGRNGAGKSTLLRILAGVARPSAGRLEIHGTRRSLLDLGAGMFEEMTGRENADMLLGLYGMRPDELGRAWQGVVDFAGLSRFADSPVRTYSSGMRIRLAYAIAIAATCDLLVADEVLAVGDEEFQRRCSRHIQGFLAAGGSLVLASHNLYHVEKLCTEAIWLDEGRVRARGTSRGVTGAYRAWVEALDDPSCDQPKTLADCPPSPAVGVPAASEIHIVCDGVRVSRVPQGAAIRVEFSPAAPEGSTLEILKPNGVCVAMYPVSGVHLRIEEPPLLPGRYRFRLATPQGLADADVDCVGSSRELGAVRLRHGWREAIPG